MVDFLEPARVVRTRGIEAHLHHILDKIHGVGADVVAELLRRMFAGERVGVVAVGEEHDFDLHTLLEEHVDGLECSVYAGRVAVVKDCHVVGEAVYLAYMSFGESRSAGAKDILYSCLMHRYDVHLPLNQVSHILFADGVFGLIDAVQFVAFGVDERLRRVDVLANIFAVRHDTSGKTHNLTRNAEDREHHACRETVEETALFGFAGKASAQTLLHVLRVGHVDKVFLGVASLLRCASKRVAFFRREP